MECRDGSRNLRAIPFLVFFFVLRVLNGAPLDLRDETSSVAGGPALSILHDPENLLQFQDLRRPDIAGRFSDSTEEAPNLGFTNYPCWGRLVVRNHSQRSDWILLFEYPRTDVLDVYIAGETRLQHFVTGDHLPFSTRPIPHQGFALPLLIAPGSTTTIHFRMQTEGTLQMPVRILTPAALADSSTREAAFLFLIYGIMIAMLAYNLFLFFSIRHLSYLYYVFYIFSAVLLQMSFNGMADRYIWGEWVWWSDRSFVILTILNILLAVIFSRRFLQLESSWPTGNRISHVFVALALFACILSFWLPLAISTRIGASMAMAGITFIVICAILLNWKGYQPARYFLLAWGTFLIGAAVYGLQKAGFLPRIFWTEYMYQIGTAIEVIVLSLALGDRINHLQNQIRSEQERAVAEQIRSRRSFERFVPKQILQFLGRESIIDVQLGDAVARAMTVLFCDIRGFTALSEKMTPEENFRFLNSYLKRISPIIREHGGFIDKYIGDAVMALFPDSAESALRAAIEMQRAVREYNRHRLRQNFDPISIGIGVHTGSVIIGTIGEEERLEGTVISDAVNLAARIEQLTKIYDAPILISQKTLFEIADPTSYHFRVVDQVQVKGKLEPVTVIQIFDGQSEYILDLFEQTRSAFDRGVHAFLKGEWALAGELFADVLKVSPNDRAAQIYRERSQNQSASTKGTIDPE